MWEIVHPVTGVVLETHETEEEARMMADDYAIGQAFLSGIGLNARQPRKMIVREAK